MALIVSYGPPGDGRAERYFDEAIAAGPSAGDYHVVRTRPRLEFLKDRAARRHGASAGERLFTFEDFVARIAARRRGARRRLDDATRLLLVAELVRDEARPPLVPGPGLVRAAAEFFRAAKAGGVFNVETATAKFPSACENAAGRAAVALLEAYTARLKAGRLYDDDGLAMEVARDFGSEELPADDAFPVRRRLVVEGLLRTSGVEREALARLFRAFPESVVLLDAEDPERLDDASSAVYDDVEIGGERFAGEAAWLRSLGARFVRTTEVPVAAPVRRYVVRDEAAEAETVAARVAEIRAADAAATILIAAPSDRAAAPRYEAAFAAARVPLAVGAARPAATSAVVRAFLAALRLPERDFPRSDVVAALRGAAGGFRYEGPDGPADLTAAALDRAARAAGIFGGRRAFADGLAAAAARARAASAARTDEDEDAPERMAAAAAEAEAVARGFAAFAALFPEPGRPLSIAEFAATASALARRTGLLRPAAPLAPRFDAVALRAAAARARGGRLVLDLLAAYVRAAPALAPRPRPFAEHAAAIRLLAERAAFAPPPAPAGAPRLVGLRDVRGLAADYVFVVGMHERAWPETVAAPPFLDEADATRAGARSAEAARREAAHLLTAACRAARREASLWRPRRVAGGETAPPDAVDAAPFGPETAPPSAPPPAGRATAAADLARAAASGVAVDDAARRAAAAGVDVARFAERLRAATNRRGTPGDGRREGLLEPEAAPWLARLFDARSARWSASRIEDYLACPLRFFFKKVLRVAPEDEPDRDVTRLEQGEALHAILRRFVTGAPPTAEDEHTAAARLAALAAEEIRGAGPADLYVESFLERAVRGLADPAEGVGPLRKFLDTERARAPGFRPLRCEASFGLPAEAGRGGFVVSTTPVRIVEPPRSDGSPPRSLLLTGSIDRLDESAPATPGGPTRWLVFDYKSGDAGKHAAAALRLRAVQLPLYAAAAEAAAEALDRPGAVVVGAAYWALSPHARGIEARTLSPAVAAGVLGNVSRRRVLTEEAERAWREAALRRAFDAADAVARGAFPPHRETDPKQDPCASCDYRRGCAGVGAAPRWAASQDPRLMPPPPEPFVAIHPKSASAAEGDGDDAS